MAGDRHGARAVAAHQAGGHAPEVAADPQQVLGVLGRQGAREQVGGDAAVAALPAEPRRGEVGAQLERVESGMREQVGAAAGAHRIGQRKVGHPVHEVDVLGVRAGVEARGGGRTPVHLPGEQVHLVPGGERREHHVLVVAHEHAGVVQPADQAHDPHGVGAAVHHVAQHVDDVVRAGGGELERAVERAQVTVRIRCHVRRHGLPSQSLRFKLNVIVTRRNPGCESWRRAAGSVGGDGFAMINECAAHTPLC